RRLQGDVRREYLGRGRRCGGSASPRLRTRLHECVGPGRRRCSAGGDRRPFHALRHGRQHQRHLDGLPRRGIADDLRHPALHARPHRGPTGGGPSGLSVVFYREGREEREGPGRKEEKLMEGTTCGWSSSLSGDFYREEREDREEHKKRNL